jgi:hypothetical protein
MASTFSLMAFRRFSKYILLALLVPGSLAAQTVVRAGTQGVTWSAAMSCPQGTIVTANPDNLHAFKAINVVTGTASGSQPTWNLQPGSLTTDGTCSWMEAGTSGLGGSNGGVTIPPSTSVGGLPNSHTPGQIVAVTDGTTPTDCAVGGGTSVVDCFWNGFQWGALTANPVIPLTEALGGTGSTAPCSTTNAVAVFGASSLGCGATLLWDGTKLTVGTPGTGYIGIPHGNTNPCIANLSNAYYCVWMNDVTSTLNCYILSSGLSCMPAGSVAGTVNNLVIVGGGNVPADGGFLASNIVRKDAVNTGGPAMTLDLSGSLGFRLPNFAGATGTSNGFCAYDTTNKNLHCGANAVDNLLAVVPASSVGSIVSGDLVGWSLVAGVVVLNDAGAPGGGGGGGGGTSQLLTTINGGASGCSGNACTGTTADQVIYSFSVGNPGNGKCVEIRGWYRTTTSSGGTKVIKVKLGSTSFAYTGYASSTPGETEFDLEICNNPGSHTAQTAVQFQPLTVSTNVTAAILSPPGTAAIDWSAGAQTIQILQNTPVSEVITWDMAQIITLP